MARYVVLTLIVLLYSWPAIVGLVMQPWLMWMYPFIIWGGIIISAIMNSRIEKESR